MQKNKSTAKDRSTLSCTFDSNNFYPRLRDAADLLLSINAVELDAMDNQKIAKKIASLKKQLNKAVNSAREINNHYYTY